MWIIIALFVFVSKMTVMAKLSIGFSGERFVFLPIPLIRLMEESALSSNLHIYSMGFFSRAQHHYINRPTGCGEYLLIYCVEGEGWIKLYNNKHNLSANQFIILPPNRPHAYAANDQNPWSIYWVHFQGTMASELSYGFDTPTQINPSAQSRISERLDLFEEIFFTLNESLTQHSLNYANLCFSHFMASFRFIDIYRKNRRRNNFSENIIRQAIHYMNENVQSSLTVNQLASFCGYSESYFYRKFIEETGHPPIDYFIKLKINKACELLIHTNIKMNQIAHKLGFKESHYFSRTFTKVMGISASEFRRLNFALHPEGSEGHISK